MKLSWRIGRVAGIGIYVHATYLLILVWIAVQEYVFGVRAVAGAMLYLFTLFSIVVLHELGHALTARRFGVQTRYIILLPIGGVAGLERMPRNPRQELLVALAGPAVNVALAIVLFAAVWLTGPLPTLSIYDFDVLSSVRGFVFQFVFVNIVLALFNMLPAFPMDGGRVLRALLATRLGYVHATEIAATIGQGVAFLLGFLGLFGNPLLIFIAIFVYLAASSEAHLVAIRAVSRGVPVTAAMMTQFATLTPDEHIDAAVETLLRTSQGEFPVVDAANRPVGVLGRNDLIRALKERGPDARVAEAMAAPVPTVGNRSCLDEAFRILQEKRMPAVGVVDMSGRLAGLVTAETVGEMLMLHRAMPQGLTFGPWGRRAAGA